MTWASLALLLAVLGIAVVHIPTPKHREILLGAVLIACGIVIAVAYVITGKVNW